MPYTATPTLSSYGFPEVARLVWDERPDVMWQSVEALLQQVERRLWADRAQADRERADRARAAGAVEDLARGGESVLAQIEALEVAKAVVEADLLSAYAALHTIESQQLDALPAGSRSRSGSVGGRVATGRIVAEEISLATGVGAGEVARRLALATAPRRHARIRSALREGTTSLHRALQVSSETAELCDADVALVEEMVLAPSRDGRMCSQRAFVTRLRRAVASVDGRGAEERRARARIRRGVFGRLTGDGMASLTVVTGADAFAAIMDRLDGVARGAVSGGDPRTLDQLRCDVATEALLHSHPDTAPSAMSAGGHALTSNDTSATTSPDVGATGSPVAPHPPDPADPPAASDLRDPRDPRAPADRPRPPTVRDTGHPAAVAWIVVPFEVATGASDAACELPGHGWVTAAHAREIITRPGSVWHTLPVDVDSGRALSRPSRGYRPTAEMVEHVEAVDGTCRAPGCEVPASRCDLDHEIAWPAGPTTVDNLHAKHRFHHNLKTDGVWSSRPTGDRGLEWTTLTGRTYLTQPKDWRAAVVAWHAEEPAPDDPPPF